MVTIEQFVVVTGPVGLLVTTGIVCLIFVHIFYHTGDTEWGGHALMGLVVSWVLAIVSLAFLVGASVIRWFST